MCLLEHQIGQQYLFCVKRRRPSPQPAIKVIQNKHHHLMVTRRHLMSQSVGAGQIELSMCNTPAILIHAQYTPLMHYPSFIVLGFGQLSVVRCLCFLLTWFIVRRRTCVLCPEMFSLIKLSVANVNVLPLLFPCGSRVRTSAVCSVCSILEYTGMILFKCITC